MNEKPTEKNNGDTSDMHTTSYATLAVPKTKRIWSILLIIGWVLSPFIIVLAVSILSVYTFDPSGIARFLLFNLSILPATASIILIAWGLTRNYRLKKF